jgi:thiol-disulfide isomerase/thioredoxin
MLLMKRITILLVIYFLSFTGCKMNKPLVATGSVTQPQPETSTVDNSEEQNYSEQASWLLGYFNQSQLKIEPHSVWFYKGYDDYKASPEAVESLETMDMEGLLIKIVMGTWCPDSRREVPRFLKVLDMWKVPYGRVIFIGVDNEKLSPIGEYEKLEIHRVPTFIIYKNNIEAGRIIENPVTSLEQDMVKILGGMNNNK